MALQDYENEKWRIVANKVGTGFTPAACRERIEVLDIMGGGEPPEDPKEGWSSPVNNPDESANSVFPQQLH